MTKTRNIVGVASGREHFSGLSPRSSTRLRSGRAGLGMTSRLMPFGLVLLRMTGLAMSVLLILSCFYVNAFASDECWDCHPVETDSADLTVHFDRDAQCDMCHGDPEEHLTQRDKSDNIINPASLGRARSNAVCLRCHEEKDKDIRERFSAVTNGHDDLNCFDCHEAHMKVPATLDDLDNFKKNMSVDCAGCHEDIYNVFYSSSHGESNLTCSDCHKLHDIHTISQEVEQQIERCLFCHPTQDLEFKYPNVHPLRERQIKCTSCHNPHSSEHDLMLNEDGDDLCELCHADIVIAGGQHPESRNTNHSRSTVKCGDCHKPHGANFEMLLIHSPDTICTTCHN